LCTQVMVVRRAQHMDLFHQHYQSSKLQQAQAGTTEISECTVAWMISIINRDLKTSVS
jgi:hypothetical protein